MTKRVAFKQADLERACKGAVAAGLQVARIEINDNGIAVIIGEPERAATTRRRTLADRLYGSQAQAG